VRELEALADEARLQLGDGVLSSPQQREPGRADSPTPLLLAP
jgi:hypothetical protein